MKTINCEQGSHEWFLARAGKVTASEVASALAFLKRGDKKGGETEGRAKYKASVVSEILTGFPDMDGYVSKCMKDGSINEPYARAAYEVKFDVSVDTVGFVVHPTIERAGSSPDGLVGNDGGLEVKCPKTATHIDYMLAGMLPPEYEPQVMFNMACTGREWWDFVSFDSRLPARHQMFRKRVMRDDKRIAEIEAGVVQFLAEVDDLIANLENLNPELTQAQRVFKNFDPDLMITDADLPPWARPAFIEDPDHDVRPAR